MISDAALWRINMLEELLNNMEDQEKILSSRQLGDMMGFPGHLIRKDLNLLGALGEFGAGYKVKNLQQQLEEFLLLSPHLKACIIGLDHQGLYLLQNHQHWRGIALAAAFDYHVNKLETMKADVPLFPVYELEDIIKMKNIRIALITALDGNINDLADQLVSLDILGILNYTPMVLPRNLGVKTLAVNFNLNLELKSLIYRINHQKS
ncbi:MAG: winged-helix domain-containing protein [Candidatus Cyclobacteriaceae bacterium M3_2C_046]